MKIYKNSSSLSKRNDRILFYDCTNFFFESEVQSGIRQYGCSKEHRPSPIIKMCLFMDGDGIPLAFSIFPGNHKVVYFLDEDKIANEASFDDFYAVCTNLDESTYNIVKINMKSSKNAVTMRFPSFLFFSSRQRWEYITLIGIFQWIKF